jgi:hypothetical protein
MSLLGKLPDKKAPGFAGEVAVIEVSESPMPANVARYRLVAWMRLHRMTFREIGERLGISHQRASQLFNCHQRWAYHQDGKPCQRERRGAGRILVRTSRRWKSHPLFCTLEQT